MNYEQITGRPPISEITIEARIKSATEKNSLRLRETFSRIADYAADSGRAVRISELNCRSCYYLNADIVIQSFTKCKCENCNKEFMWGTSDTPKLCHSCGIKYQACRWCYAAINN